MPVLIDEFDLTLVDDPAAEAVAPTDADPASGAGAVATLMPLEGKETMLANVLDLLRERRARLLVD